MTMNGSSLREAAEGMRVLGAAFYTQGRAAAATASQIRDFTETLDRVEREPLNDGLERKVRPLYEVLRARGLLTFTTKRRRPSRSLYIRKGGVKK